MVDFSNSQIRSDFLEDLYGSSSLLQRFYKKKNSAHENRYLYCDANEKTHGICTGIAVNKNHVRLTFELKPQQFDNFEQIFGKGLSPSLRGLKM